MIDKIQKLIQEHKNIREEIHFMLNELNQIDEKKMEESLIFTIKRYEMEYTIRGNFINDLENLL